MTSRNRSGRMSATSAAVGGLLLGLYGCTGVDLKGEVDAQNSSTSTEHIIQGITTQRKIKGSASDVEKSALNAQDVAVVRRATKPWIGGRFSAATRTDGLPALFDESYVLDFGNERVSLAVLATRLSKMTNVPVRVRSDVFATSASNTTSSGAAAASTTAATPVRTSTEIQAIPGGSVSSTTAIAVDGVSMRWTGKLRDFMDFLANTLNLSWEYTDGAIVVMVNVVETHPVAGMAGQQTFENTVGATATGSTTSGTSSGSTIQSADSYSEKGSINSYVSVVDTVKGIVGSGAGRSVIPDPSSGTIVVSAPKDIQAQVRDYLREKNRALSQLISVTIDIYSFADSATDSQGVNWNLAFADLAKTYNLAAASPTSVAGVAAGTFTLTSLAGEAAGTSAIVQALNQTGKSFQHTPVSLTTTNGRMKVSQPSVASQGYVSKTTPSTTSSTGTTGTVGLETSTVTTGDVYSVLPILQPDNSIDLRYSFRLSTLLGITTFTSGSGANMQSVQIPQTSSVSDTGNVHLAPGQAVLIAGLSRIVSASSNNRLAEGASIGLGGSSNNKISREHMMVLVRATPLGTAAVQ